MKQLKYTQVPKQSHLLDKFISEKSIYSDRNFFLNQYRTINRLLKLNYSYYYKYNYSLYILLKKFFYLNVWRFYIKPLSIISIITPFYKFLPQIQLKDYLFYKYLTDHNKNKKLYILNKKQFCITASLKLYTKYFRKVLPGGLNSFFLSTNNTDVSPLIDPTSVLQKKFINFTNLDTYTLLLDIISIIFLISLSNYILFYSTIKCTVFVRL
jgi:hypothetical protein